MFFKKIHAHFRNKSLVQLGSVFPDAGAVHPRHCVSVECDGPSLMFVCAFCYVFASVEFSSCLSKSVRVSQNICTFYEKH